LDLFWETSGEILKNTERLTLRNSIALSFSRVLSIFCQVFFEKEPDSILQFMTKLADRVMNLRLRIPICHDFRDAELRQHADLRENVAGKE
jgi:hypothetical protein